jgi:hypothetical protein
VKGKGRGPWMVWSYAGDFPACLIPTCAGYFTESCYLLSKNIVGFIKFDVHKCLTVSRVLNRLNPVHMLVCSLC